MAFFKRRRGISLTSFVRGIVKALTDAQQAIPHSREDHLRHHMTVDKEGVLTPKMFTVNMEDGRRINIPTYNFASVNTIGISSATIKCAARIVDLDQTRGGRYDRREASRHFYCPGGKYQKHV